MSSLSDEGGADNRGIIDDQTAQKLDRDDITDLKEQGKSGQVMTGYLYVAKVQL